MKYEQYIGVDLHKAFFQACAVDGAGARCWEDRFPRTGPGLAAFCDRCGPRTAVAVEASTPTWHFADAISAQVGWLVVVDPWKTKLKAGYAAKTDRLDARRLADALRRESVVGVYYPPPVVREWRELCRGRQALVRARSQVTHRLRAVLLRQGEGDAPASLSGPRGTAYLAGLTLPPRAAASVTALQTVLHQINAQVRPLETEVQREAAADPVVQRLMTIRGIGPIVGLIIRAELGTIERFATPGQVASYAGLVPRVAQSAGRAHYGRITKRGSPWLRWALIEAAMHGPRRSDRFGRWARRLAVRKGALKARVAVARALCTEIFHVWPR